MKLEVLEYIKTYQPVQQGSSSPAWPKKDAVTFNKIVEGIFPKASTYTWTKFTPIKERHEPYKEQELTDLSDGVEISDQEMEKLQSLIYGGHFKPKDTRSIKQRELFDWALLMEALWDNEILKETPSSSPTNSPVISAKSIDQSYTPFSIFTAEQQFQLIRLIDELWQTSWSAKHSEADDLLKHKSDYAGQIIKDIRVFMKDNALDEVKFRKYEEEKQNYIEALTSTMDAVLSLYKQADMKRPDEKTIMHMAETIEGLDYWKKYLKVMLGDAAIYDVTLESLMQDMGQFLSAGKINDAQSFDEIFIAALFENMIHAPEDRYQPPSFVDALDHYHASQEYAIRELFPFPETALSLYLSRSGKQDTLEVVPPIQSILEAYTDDVFDKPRVLETKSTEEPKDIIRAQSFEVEGKKIENEMEDGAISSTNNRFTQFKDYIQGQENLPASVKQAALTQLSQNGILWAGGVDLILRMSNKKSENIFEVTGEGPSYIIVPTNEKLESSVNVSLSENGKELYVDCSYTPKAFMAASSTPGVSKLYDMQKPVELVYRLEVFENEQGNACVKVQVKSWEKVAEFLQSAAAVARQTEKEHPELARAMPSIENKMSTPHL